jgi:histone H3/H4
MAEDMIVVKAKIKELAKGYNVAGDFADALNEKTRDLVKDAIKRAEANNRKTIMAKDL